MTWHLRGLSPTFNSIADFASGKIIYLFYILPLHVANVETHIPALLVQMGQIKVHGTWDPGHRHQTDRDRVTKGHLCLSLHCAQRSGKRILQGNCYCALVPYPLLPKSLKQQGFHTDREYVVDLLYLFDAQHRGVKDRLSGICWTDEMQNISHSWENISCTGEINIYFSCAGKHVTNKWHAPFF